MATSADEKTAGDGDPSEPPYWSIVALGLPSAAIVIGLVAVSGSAKEGVLGGVVEAILVLIGLGVIGVLGAASAIAGLIRRERKAGLGWLALVINGVLLTLLLLLLRL